MSGRNQRADRRADALSRERIVDTAIAILDAEGAAALTFRALASRLATGSGAIYWHVADKDALLAAATDRIIAESLLSDVSGAEPEAVLRALALAVFDTIEAHPWIGAQLSGDPWQNAVLRVLEAVGAQVQAMGLPTSEQFNAATALMSFMLGLAGQYALRTRRFAGVKDRAEALREVADRWAALDPEQHPFVREIAEILPDHDDREQFRAGIDLILSGMKSLRDKESA